MPEEKIYPQYIYILEQWLNKMTKINLYTISYEDLNTILKFRLTILRMIKEEKEKYNIERNKYV